MYKATRYYSNSPKFTSDEQFVAAKEQKWKEREGGHSNSGKLLIDEWPLTRSLVKQVLIN